MKYDRLGNNILTAEFHAKYDVIKFNNYKILTSIDFSQTTESVYVTYRYNDKSITCRFSNHICNAVEFGDQLDGNLATPNEILYKLGLVSRIFIPETFLYIDKYSVKKSKMVNYEECELTLKEMYNLGANFDISKFTGKLAKGTNTIINGSKIEVVEKTGINRLGSKIVYGTFIYS